MVNKHLYKYKLRFVHLRAEFMTCKFHGMGWKSLYPFTDLVSIHTHIFYAIILAHSVKGHTNIFFTFVHESRTNTMAKDAFPATY